MASGCSWCFPFEIGRGQYERPGFWQKFLKKKVVGNADADSIKVIIIEMFEAGIFGQNQGDFAWDVFLDERFGGVWDKGILANLILVSGYKSENFAGIVISLFEPNEFLKSFLGIQTDSETEHRLGGDRDDLVGF